MRGSRNALSVFCGRRARQAIVSGTTCLLGFFLHAADLSGQVAGGHPAWSPFEDRIAFEQLRGGTSVILILDLEARSVASAGDLEVSNHHPAWSPDGRRIAYTSGRDGNVDIFVWDGDRKTEVRVTRHPARDETPAWAPDGRFIAFASRRDGGGIHLVDPASGEVTPVLPASVPRPATRPSWSPDGREIAFHAGVGDAREIWVLDVRERTVRRLTRNDAADTAPHWSPNGREIVFSSKRDGGRRELYVVDTEGRRARRLTDHEADDADGSWSPTGDRLVFYSDRSGAYELWLLNPRTGAAEPVPPVPGTE